MRKICKIAQNELATLFYSPVAWLILIIFALQCGLIFIASLHDILSYVPSLEEDKPSMTSWLFCGSFATFDSIRGILYLYIPLLTMGLMSREFSSGSVKLLYSSPLTSVQIIWGKYIAMLVYGLVMLCIMGCLVIAGACWIEHLDMPNVLTALLGLYLLICAYAAIGLFMSCLTSYQIVAAIATLAVLAVLNFIGGVGQGIDFVRDITYWFSISGRVGIFLSGLICSGDVLYFMLVIALFLTLSVLKLQGDRHRYPRWFSVTRYVGTVASVVALGYLTTRPFALFYYDSTATQRETLSPASQAIVRKIPGKLTLTSYVNLLGNNTGDGMPSRVNANTALFRQYLRLKPEMEMKYIYYYKAAERTFPAKMAGWSEEQKARKMAELYKMSFQKVNGPEAVDTTIDLSGEGYHFVRVFEDESGKRAFLRVFADMVHQPGEAEISAALKRLTVETVPRVGFVKGHGERQVDKEGDRDYYFFANNPAYRYALMNQGFDVLTLSLDKGVPAGVNILVISDMRNSLTEAELEHLKSYLARGGNLLLLGECGRQSTMNPLAELVGVRFMPGTLVQRSKDFDATLLLCRVTEQAAGTSPAYQKLKKWNRVVSMPGTVGLEYRTDAGFQVEPVLTTADTGCWNELTTTDFTLEKPELSGEAGETEQAYPTVLALHRSSGGREQRVIVAGDADWLSNRELSVFREGLAPVNHTVLTEVFRWLSNGEFPVAIRYSDPRDVRLDLALENLSGVKLVFTGLLPLLFLIGGIWMYWRRRRG